MCGIVGYLGKRQATPIILEGLRRLEYRGYDSAGIAVVSDGAFDICKRKGKIDTGLARSLAEQPLHGTVGLGHTRWATHGAPTDENSHPHLDQSGKISVVHNGVIENYDRIKQRLLKAGHTFKSATDTEVLAHLIGEHYQKLDKSSLNGTHPLTQAVLNALKEVIGTYGIGVMSVDDPGVIVGARRGSPLILGLGENENFLASDTCAIVSHTRQVVYLNDYDVVTLTPEKFDVVSLGSDTAKVQISKIEFSVEDSEKGNFAHYMLKEIFEQPRTVRNAMRGRIDTDELTAKFGGLNMSTAELRAVDQVVINAWHELARGNRRGVSARGILASPDGGRVRQ